MLPEYVPSKIRTELRCAVVFVQKVGEFEPRLASSVDDFDRPRVLARTRAYSRARCRAVAAPVDFKLCTDVCTANARRHVNFREILRADCGRSRGGVSLLRWTEIHRSGKQSEYEYPIVPSACRDIVSVYE